MGYQPAYADTEPSRDEVDAVPGWLVVEFGAPWCPHCVQVQPILADLLQRFPEVKHIKIHDGKGQPLGRSFRVKLWPNLVFMRDGQVVRQLARPSDAQILEAFEALSQGRPDK